jgi:2-(3-amino-3-carboxypropyl)histidine synthase
MRATLKVIPRMEPQYDLELDKVVQEVERRKCKRLILQMPDGLMKYALQVSSEISRITGAETITSLDTCYGACDLATNAASRLGADLIVHYGHSPWIRRSSIPTLYVEAFASLQISPILPKTIKFLKGAKRIGLLSTIQHIHEIGKVKEFLEKNGFEVLIGKASGRVRHAGQVLGCDYSSARSVSGMADKFVLIGGGEFHSIGLGLETRKECIVVDPYAGNVFTTKELLRRYLKSRYACIMEAKEATRFGVIIGLKFGQLNFSEALRVKDKLRYGGKSVTMFCVDNLDPERLNYMDGIDAFVIVACPRIAVDDALLFRKPILTPEEIEFMLSDDSLLSYLSLG